MSSTINLGNLSVSVFGESHGPAIGVVIDNLPAGKELSLDKIYEFMSRRAPKGRHEHLQKRKGYARNLKRLL